MNRRSVRRGLTVVAVGAVALAVSSIGQHPVTATPVKSTPAAATASNVPVFDHVVIAVFENERYSKIIGNPAAPYLTSLSTQGANFTQSFAITHPSQPNYLAMFSGSTQGITNDACPQNLGNIANLGSQLLGAGRTFAGYSEDLPAVGSTVCTSAGYARKHNPWVDFSNVPASANQPYTGFPTDYTTLPTLSYVIPNLCHDMHDCSITVGDSWAQANLDAYAQWAKTHNSLLIVTFDEDDFTNVNQIATVFVGANVVAGNYSETIDHYTVLRTLEDMYGLAPLANAANRTAITDVWTTAPPPQAIVNGGFEAGTALTGWTVVSGSAAVSTAGPHSGSRLARVGRLDGVTADSLLRQNFTAPAGTTTLTLWWKGACRDTSLNGYAQMVLFDATAATTRSVLKPTCVNDNTWRQVTAPVVAGHAYTLRLKNHDNGDTNVTLSKFDDVSVT